MRRFTTVLIALLCTLAFPASAFAVDPLEWSVTPKNLGQPLGATLYTLSNDRGGSLRYGSRVFGVDLVWGAGRQWEFLHNRFGPLKFRDHRTVPATETVALYNTAHHQYLASGFQRFGVDLVWSTTPRFQWKVYEGQSSAPGREGNVRVKLYNTIQHAYLIYGAERFGINLIWLHAPYTTPPPNSPS